MQHPTAPASLTAVTRWPDRLKLAFAFDADLLADAVAAAGDANWIDHFVTRNYDGRWTAIALRAPAGTEHQHPILQLTSHPGTTAYADTPALDRMPYVRDVLETLAFPMHSVRLMNLEPGSTIKTHCDPDLDSDQGCVRLHVPMRTNPDVEFLLNGRRVDMRVGECWYLRLSDPHSVRNAGTVSRVHLVIDAPMSPRLAALMTDAAQTASSHAS